MVIDLEALSTQLGVIVAILTSCGALIAIIRKWIMAPINEKLTNIEAQNEDLKVKCVDIKTELSLTMKLQQTMINELNTKGHLNGDTQKAKEELEEYLRNK